MTDSQSLPESQKSSDAYLGDNLYNIEFKCQWKSLFCTGTHLSMASCPPSVEYMQLTFTSH